MLPKSCSDRKSLQSSRRHICRTTLLSYKRNLVTQQQESCQTVLSQRKRNWNRCRQGIHFCDSIYLPRSTFLSLVSIFCVPHLIPVGDSAGVTEYQAAELISQVWAHSALVLGPSHHCGPCSPGRRVMYTWLLFTSLEMLDRRPKTGFVSRSRHNISLWSGRIILWDSALGWHIHKLLGDLFFCKHTDMTQIILMQLRVKILGENTTPNHLPKKISCEAKYCTVVVVFFFAWLSTICKFSLVGPWETAHPRLWAPRLYAVQSGASTLQCGWKKKSEEMAGILHGPRWCPRSLLHGTLSAGLPAVSVIVGSCHIPSSSPASLPRAGWCKPSANGMCAGVNELQSIDHRETGPLLFF